MMLARRRSLVAAIGSTLMAALVVCPLMATAAATPAAPSCHDRPAPEQHGDTSTAVTCCAIAAAATSATHAPDVGHALPPTVDRGQHAPQHTPLHADHPRPRSAPPPLFVRHAALLI